jgi:hypothetical protein
MALVNFECCICGKSIDRESGLDPCAISIFTNIDKDESEQLEQIFFSHYRCFRDSMVDSDVREMLILEDQK